LSDTNTDKIVVGIVNEARLLCRDVSLEPVSIYFGNVIETLEDSTMIFSIKLTPYVDFCHWCQLELAVALRLSPPWQIKLHITARFLLGILHDALPVRALAQVLARAIGLLKNSIGNQQAFVISMFTRYLSDCHGR